MQIVLPITTHDFQLLESQVSVMEHFGGLEDFDIILAPSSAVILDVEPFAERLRLIAKSATVINVGYMEFGKWPHGPNKHWVSTVYALDAMIPQGQKGDCWLWHEMDLWATETGAYKKLLDAHLRGNKFFTGKIVPKPSRDAGGNIAYHTEGFEDMMMMGCAVYPSGMSKNPQWSAQANPLRDFQAPIPGLGEPNGWDVELRTFFKNAGWTHTDLIGDRWNTVNYRMEDCVLKCDAGPTPFKNRAHNDTDITGACLIHGVKDDSLAKLILSGTFGAKTIPAVAPIPAWTPEVKTAQSGPSGETVTPTQTMRIAALEHEIADLKKRLSALEAKPSAAPATVAGEPEQPKSSTIAEGVRASAESSPILDQIDALIPEGKSARIGDLAKKVGMKRTGLELVIEASSRFGLKAPGWVYRKAA